MKASNWVMLGLMAVTAAVASAAAVQGVATWLEAIGFVTGAACVWLTVKESVWNFPISLLNVSVLCVVFYEIHLYGDASLQVVFFILTAVGWYMWLYGGKKRTALKVSREGKIESALTLVGIAAGTIILWQTLSLIGSASATFWDALTTSLSLGAQWLLNRKKLENWLAWIAADIIYVPLYLSKGLYLMSILYAVFLVMATMGLMQWVAKWRAQHAAASPAREQPVEAAA